MLGKNHALLGAACWMGAIAVTSRTHPEIFHSAFANIEASGQYRYATLALSTVAAAGCAVLPDFDEPEATAAKTFGVAGKMAAKTVRFAAGGHRQRTHTLLFAVLAWYIGLGAAQLWEKGNLMFSVPAILCVGVFTVWGFLLIGRAAEDRDLLRKLTIPVAWLAGLAAAIFMVAGVVWNYPWWLEGLGPAASPEWWLPYAMAAGVVFHLLGDLPTQSGVPVLWPVTKARFALKMMKVGSRTESYVAALVFIGLIISSVLAVQAFADPPPKP